MLLINRVRRPRRGPCTLSSDLLDSRRLNYSFVLHEPSDSVNVTRLARASVRHDVQKPKPFGRYPVYGVSELSRSKPECILTAHVGVPVLMGEIASCLGVASLIALDVPSRATKTVEFFRAPSRLAAPDGPWDRIVVAAAISRPGGSSYEVVASDILQLDEEPHAVLRALERLVRSYVDQWRPPEPLWDGPAELLLPEVLKRI